ncbi:PUA-like domain-containing protein [Amylostereum chailletii]|nr:PUA-like domain-containing protein [Amylostereum chailletii]
MPTPYEIARNENIARNHALLESLGLGSGGSALVMGAQPKPALATKAKAKKAPAKKQTQTRKRKTPPPSDSGDSDGEARAPAKVARTEETGGLRRSSRNRGKTVDYRKEREARGPKLVARAVGPAHDRDPGRLGKRVHDPKVFGAIPGVKAGDWWESRELCSNAAIHAPWVAGISGSSKGAYSIALSGGYEDDVDLGEAFTFTGAGGRDLKGTKNKPKNLRTAPQSCDQTFENAGNKALLASSKSKKPVRVIRGFKSKSQFAPLEGYRYDGLYTVEKAWQEKGLNAGGFKVCKFAFKRIPGQLPLPQRGLAEPNADAEVFGDEGEEEAEIDDDDDDGADDDDEEDVAA